MLPVLISVIILQEGTQAEFVKFKFPEQKRYVYAEKTTIYFDFDSYEVKEAQRKKLEKFKEGDTVLVSGFASPEGNKRYNLLLSRKRAKAVADLLKERGVQVEIKAEGEDHCYVPNKGFYPECRKVEVEEFHGDKGFDLP